MSRTAAPSTEAISSLLRARGHLLNAERKTVLQAFVASGGPVHAEQLWATARSQRPISRATVSRTLKLLHELGVAELAARDGGRNYFSLKGAARRVTLVDASAREVRQIEVPQVLAALEAALAEAGFALADGVEVRVTPLVQA
jgi:Fe2+ or Zn2+ uptake regulation protein